MSTPPPNYLRVHRGDKRTNVAKRSRRTRQRVASSQHADAIDQNAPLSQSPADGRGQEQPVSSMDQFWHAYTEATGWRIDAAENATSKSADPTRRPQSDLTGSPSPGDVSLAGLAGNDSGLQLMRDAGLADDLGIPAVSAKNAKQLALAAKTLADQLHNQQQLLEQQQVELAARSAVIADENSSRSLSASITKILGDAAMATQTDAAAVYLLDDQTEKLTARFLFGLAPDKRLGHHRELRGARIDLESMITGVVAIDQLRAGPIDTCNAPEDFASAICVCLGSIDCPIGTLWLFGHREDGFTDNQTAAARLAASNVHGLLSRCGDELSSHSLSVFGSIAPADRKRSDEPSDSAATKRIQSEIGHWQMETLPVGQRLTPDWSVDGMIESPHPVAQSWHHWDVLPDGVLAFAICQASRSMSHLLDATLVRGALHAHASYRHRASDAILRTLDTLLQVHDEAFDDRGRPSVSLLYGHVNPLDGQTAIASIGDWSSLIVSKHGYRPLPLGKPQGKQTSDLPGVFSPQQHTTYLQSGEVLLVATNQWMGLDQERRPGELSAQFQIGTDMAEALRHDASSPLSALRRLLADRPLTQERAAVSLQRA